MIGIAKKIYSKLSGHYIVEKMAALYRGGFVLNNLYAYFRLRRNAFKKRHRRAKVLVVFLGQNVQVWNKIRPIFEQMLTDCRFKPVLMAVPEISEIAGGESGAYQYFYDLYGDHVVDAYADGKWRDLRTMDPDYVFYQRPYDQYLPKKYRSGVVAGYSKVCYVDYALSMSSGSGVSKCMLFFRNVSLYFADTLEGAKNNWKRMPWSHRNGVRRTCNLGYPVLESVMKSRKPMDAVKERHSSFQILWTPRWTDNKFLGGSNFFAYKDEIVGLVRKEVGLSLVFRPHPLLFGHFIESGQMKEGEAQRYLSLYQNNPRLQYDSQADYMDTFWESDVLLTDYSSMLVEFFVTGKPIVYCECDAGIRPNRLFSQILEVAYIAGDWQEAEGRLKDLAKGNDPLRKARQKKVKELFGGKLMHVSERILEEMHNDYLRSTLACRHPCPPGKNRER